MNELLLDSCLSECVDYTEGIADLLYNALDYCENDEDLARINGLIKLTNELYSALV